MTIQEMYQEMEEQLEDDVLLYDDACVVSVGSRLHDAIVVYYKLY